MTTFLILFGVCIIAIMAFSGAFLHFAFKRAPVVEGSYEGLDNSGGVALGLGHDKEAL